MMWRLPVVASDWRGNSDVLGQSEGGFLYSPPQSPQALADKIMELLDQRSRWSEFGEASRRKYQEHYQRQSGTDKLVEHLVELAKTSKE